VVNFGNPDIENEFSVGITAEDQVEINEQKKSLSLAIERAEANSPQEVTVSRIENSKVQQTGKSFFDETKQVLYIGIEKQSIRDAKIEVELQTSEGNFPFTGLMSSILEDNNKNN